VSFEHKNKLMTDEIKNIQEKKTKKSLIKTIFNKIAFSKTESSKEGMVLDKAIKRMLHLIVFLTPLWFLPITVNAIEFNKQTLMVLLIVITLILWLVKILSQGQVRWKSNILNLFIGAFLVISILSTVFSLRIYGSLVGWPTHLSGALINTLSFLALYFLVINNFKGIKQTFGLLFTFLVSSAVVTVIGLLQIWGGFVFPWEFTKLVSFNTIGTVNSFGIISATLLTLLTALLFVIKKKEIKIFLVILGLLNLLILLSLNFWAIWLVLAVGMAIILIFGLMRLVKLEESIGWIALPMAFLAISLVFILFNPALPVRPEIPTEVGLSHKGGLEVVNKTLRVDPILGTGPETFSFNYSKYKPSEINQTMFWNIRFSNPPAEIYSIASDLGILGLISFLAILLLFVIKAVKNIVKTIGEEKNVLKQFLEIGLFAGWFGLAVSWFVYPQNFTLMFVFWLLMSLYLAESSVFKSNLYNLKKSPKILLLTSFSFVVIIIVIVGFLYIQGTRFVAEAQYKQGLNMVQSQGRFDEGLNTIIKSTIINPYEDRTYNILSQLFILKMNRDANLAGLDQQQRLNLMQVDAINAINSAVRATKLSPQDVSNWLTRGQVYRQLIGFINGADEWSEKSFEEAIKLEPLNPFTLTQWGRALIAMNEEERALEKLNQAIEVKPDYADAHFRSAVVFEAQGKLNEAITKLEINRQLLPQDKGIAFQLGVLYYRAERYRQAGAEFVRAVIIDPDYANARYFLGLLYDQAGDKESALDQFERIAKLNPDNEHIKDVIENLKTGRPALGSPDLGPPEQPEDIPIKEVPEEQNKETQP
jgi:putative inorganic carbon (HCO3(-)) transporter